MRILAIVGSGRDGNTLTLTEIFLRKMEALATASGEEFQSEILQLRDLKLPFCLSCHNCVTEKGDQYCPHHEIVAVVAKKLLAADGVILASPVYSLQISGLMKNLIDHLSFYFHRPCLFDKYGLALTDTAGSGHRAAGGYLQTVMHAWGIGKPQVLPLALRNVKVVMDRKMERKLTRAAERFYSQITNKESSSPSLYDLGYFNIWRVFISTSPPPGADYEYWQKRGWLDQNYYYTAGVSSVKLALGGFLYRLMKKLLSKSSKPEREVQSQN
jgi:multimeric flavodoxin WrbA